MKENEWKNAVVYQIYPKSFNDTNGDGIGDLPGIIDKLDYLKDLGIDIIWLSPFFPSPMADNGYDISDYQGIEPSFGTMEDMDRLLEEADRRDIRIVIDLVLNHTSDEHDWFKESSASLDNPKRDWYIWRSGDENGEPPNNWRSNFGGSAWEWDERTNQYYLHVFDKKQPDLNWENKEMRQAVYQMIHWWMEKAVAGFRVDAITYIKKNKEFPSFEADGSDGMVTIDKGSLNQPGIKKHLQELKEKGFRHDEVFTVAEAPGVPADEIEDYIGEHGFFTMLFEFDHVDLDLTASAKWYEMKEWTVHDFKKPLFDSQRRLQEGWSALYIENHDQPRSLSRFIQEGFRHTHSAKMLAAVYFLMKGTPYIYQGQEIGMTNVEYPDISSYNDAVSRHQYDYALANGCSEEEALAFIWKRSRDNTRTPMQWDASHQGGFTEGSPWLETNSNYPEVNVETVKAAPDSLYTFYQKLIAFRKHAKAAPIIEKGAFQALLEEDDHIVAYKRTYEDQEITLYANFTAERVPVSFDEESRQAIVSNNDGLGPESAWMEPYDFVIFSNVDYEW